MTQRIHPIKPSLALTVALITIAPAVAQARPIIDPPASQPALSALASTTSSPRQLDTVAAGGGFDWEDAGIGAGLGLALATVGTGLIIAGKQRRRPHLTIR